MTRPRAADDFVTIRARLDELRRERAQILTDQKGGSPIGPRSNPATRNDAEHQGDRDLPRSMRRSFLR